LNTVKSQKLDERRSFVYGSAEEQEDNVRRLQETMEKKQAEERERAAAEEGYFTCFQRCW
jgi:hypothetical protein